MNSRTHKKTQNSAIFVKKKLKINMLKIKQVKLRTIVIIQENL